MDTVPRPPDLPHAICPTCGSTPSARSLRRNGSVRVEDYSDAAGHIWTTKWLEVA